VYRNHSIGVVIPAYNEAEFVADVVRGLPGFVDRVYLIDDGSTDGTWSAMGQAVVSEDDASGFESERAATSVAQADLRADGIGDSVFAQRIGRYETNRRIIRIQHAQNRGAGGAIKTGYYAALCDGVDIITTVDGDKQMNGQRLPDLLDPIVEGRAGYAKGDRFSGKGIPLEMPFFRLFGNLLLTVLTRAVTGYWGLSDSQNGFSAISRSALSQVDLEALPEYYGYMNNLLARLNAAEVPVADVEMPATYGDEDSHIEIFQYVVQVSRILLHSFFERLRRKSSREPGHPVTLCYLGSVLITVATVCKTLHVSGSDMRSRPSLRSGIVASLVALVAGVIADWSEDPKVVDLSNDAGKR